MMGTTDEHWCNLCQRNLDKGKDEYVEFELVNAPQFKPKIREVLANNMKKAVGKDKPLKPKGIICQKCIDKDPKLKAALELMVKAGNPNFVADVICLSAGKCGTYLPKNLMTSNVNCGHISVLSDRLYCKRSHPGVVRLPQEKAEVERLTRTLLNEYFQKLIKNPQLKKLMDTSTFEKMLETAYTSPSGIIQQQYEHLPKQAT